MDRQRASRPSNRRAAPDGGAPPSRLWVPVAAAGVVVGHVLTYLVAVPQAHQRDAVLHETGHAYFPVAAQAALLVGAVALAALFLRRLTGIDRFASARTTLFGRLAWTQVLAFAAMEVAERVATGAPLTELVHDHVLVGVMVQVLIAWLGARLVEALCGAADRARVLLAGRPHVRTFFGSLVLPRREPATHRTLPAAPARAPPSRSFPGR